MAVPAGTGHSPFIEAPAAVRRPLPFESQVAVPKSGSSCHAPSRLL